MNVYSVMCLELGDLDSLFTSAEKATRYLFNTYANDVDFSNEPSPVEVSKILKKNGNVYFTLKDNNETVKVTKVKVY